MNLQITHTIGGKNPQPLFVNTGHDSTFEKFKNLVSSLTKTKIESVRYEDEDGDLITVESEPEFEEIKKLGSRQVKVFVDASPLVAEKPKAWGPELISFATAPAATVPEVPKPQAQTLPSTMEALAKPAPAPQVRFCRIRQPAVQPAPAFKVVSNVIKPTPVVLTPSQQCQPVHSAYCDNCNATIVGIRYKCANCLDYDLCEACEAENITKNIHDQKHIFLKIRSPIRSGLFSPLPNLYEGCGRGFGFHHHSHALCNQRLNALEAKVNALLGQSNAAAPAPAPTPAPVVVPVPVKAAEEKLEERRQKREKARQEREAKREQRIQLKQKKLQEKQEVKQQKLQAAQAAQQAAPAQQLNLAEIPVILKVEEVKAVEVPAKVESVVEATVTIEEVEDEFHQQAKEQPVVVEAKVEEVVEEKKEEKNWNEVAEDFVKVNKEEEEPHPYAAQLNILQEMGFSAVDRLAELLKQFNGDLQAVLQTILETL